MSAEQDPRWRPVLYMGLPMELRDVEDGGCELRGFFSWFVGKLIPFNGMFYEYPKGGYWWALACFLFNLEEGDEIDLGWVFPAFVLLCLLVLLFAILPTRISAQPEPGAIFADGFETGSDCAWTADGCVPPLAGVLSRDIRTISRACVDGSTVRVENERCVTDEPQPRSAVVGWDSGKRVQVCLPPARSERFVWEGPARASDGCGR